MSRLSAIDADEVATRLTAFVNAAIMARGRSIAADDQFEAAGVDSMGLLKVLLFIETEFGFWMPDEDLVEGNVASPRALATYVCRQRDLS
jgi:acyl carrier protein